MEPTTCSKTRPVAGIRNSDLNSSRRFIAGAVCPQCQAVDRTLIESVRVNNLESDLDDMTKEVVQRRCVACGFTEALDPEKADVTAPLPRARYEKSRQTTERVEVVKILDPAAAKKVT